PRSTWSFHATRSECRTRTNRKDCTACGRSGLGAALRVAAVAAITTACVPFGAAAAIRRCDQTLCRQEQWDDYGEHTKHPGDDEPHELKRVSGQTRARDAIRSEGSRTGW